MLNLTENQEAFSKQVPKNLIANILYFILNVLIGLFLVPYFIDKLGVASYGLIPLATSLTSYVNLVTQSLNSSVSRYLTIDLQKRDYKKANITFNTSLFGTFGITLLTVPILVIVSYYSPLFFDIPINQRQDAFLLFLGVMGSLLVRTWGGNFGVSLFAYNRLDLQNIINSINLVLQVVFIIILFSLSSPRLSYIGYSYFIAAVVALFITIILSKKVNPHFKVKIQDFKSFRLKELMGTGGWITIDYLGSLLLFQMDIIIVNKLFGTVAGGEYSIVLMWNILIRTIAGMLAGVLTPVILTYYAQKKFEDLVILSKSAVKLMGLAIALPIGLICGFSPLILSFWVGPEFSRLSPLMWILLGHLAINMSVLPLFPINISYNKLRIPAIATIFSGIANLLLAVTLSSITGWGYYGVAVAGAIVLTARHFFFVPMYAAKVLGMSNNPFKNTMIQVFLSTLIVAGIASTTYYLSNISSALAFIFICGIISFVYLPIVWYVLMNQTERRIVESFIPPRLVNMLKININYS
ncbi:MAG: lipopolysaccharide biosynthesis protein [Methanosarcina sp.]|nr:polysaccharide biosynthesis protein [Methanosarcina sp. Ant1]